MVPTGAEVCKKQLLGFMHKVREVKVNESEIGEFMPSVYEELNDISKNDLIKRFASIEFNRFLDYYRNAPDLNDGRKTTDFGEGRDRGGDARIFINLGKMDDLDKAGLLELIDEYTGLEKKDIGQIDLKGAYSFFEVEKSLTAKVQKGFENATHKGRPVRVEITESKKSSGQGENPDAAPRKKFSDNKFSDKKFSDKKSSDKKYSDKKYSDKKSSYDGGGGRKDRSFHKRHR